MNSALPLVVKFGGSTFTDGSADYRRVGHYLTELHREQQRPIVAVVSAPPGATEATRARLYDVNADADPRYVATLFSLPDTESAIMLAAAVQQAGLGADALNGHQNGIITDRTPLWSRVTKVDAALLRQALSTAEVICLASGHGADATGRFTWMGKNSGDLSALVVAAALGVDTVDIYSDVDGVYSADPRLIPDAQLLPRISFDVARIMAARGAKVLDRRALDVAHAHHITIYCRRNRADYHHGTTVTRDVDHIRPAIIIDTRSVVLRCDTPQDADHTFQQLADRGLPCLRVQTDAYENAIAVTGGFTNVDTLVAQRKLPAIVTGAKLVSAIHSQHANDFIAADTDAAIDLGRKLHGRYLRNSSSITTTT
jgi:aspartate kinase